jgi:hypothetical protein
MKRFMFLTVVTFLCVMVSISGAFAYLITDNPQGGDTFYTLSRQYTAPTSPTSNFSDEIPQDGQFQTNSIQIDWIGQTLKFTLNTNMLQNGVTVGGQLFKPADIALDLGKDCDWDAGIYMKGPNQYQMVSVSQWGTSKDRMASLSGFTYGGGYKVVKNGATLFASEYVPVDILSGSLMAAGSGTWDEINDRVTITFDLSGNSHLGDLEKGFYTLWGTAQCGNDIVTDKVPIPGSVLLLGSGLLGLVGLRRRVK